MNEKFNLNFHYESRSPKKSPKKENSNNLNHITPSSDYEILEKHELLLLSEFTKLYNELNDKNKLSESKIKDLTVTNTQLISSNNDTDLEKTLLLEKVQQFEKEVSQLKESIKNQKESAEENVVGVRRKASLLGLEKQKLEKEIGVLLEEVKSKDIEIELIKSDNLKKLSDSENKIENLHNELSDNALKISVLENTLSIKNTENTNYDILIKQFADDIKKLKEKEYDLETKLKSHNESITQKDNQIKLLESINLSENEDLFASRYHFK